MAVMSGATVTPMVPGIIWRPILLIFIMTLVIQLGYYVSIAPQLRLLETIFCEQYYSKHPEKLQMQTRSVPEKLCKINSVQEAVANVLGWQSFFEAIPGLLLAMPYGAIADKYGRRIVITASMVGMFLSSFWILFVCWTRIPLKLMWLSSAFIAIGGGSTVAAAIAMAVITEATPQSQRSRMFFYFQAMNIALAIVGPAIGALLMERSVWIPLLLQVGCSFAAVPMSVMIPESLASNGCVKADGQSSEIPRVVESDRAAENPIDPDVSPVSVLKHCSRTIKFVIHDRRIMLLTLAFLISSFATQSLSIVLQYASKRYQWGLAKTSSLLSLRGGLQLLFYVTILPGLDAGLARWLAISSKLKDLLLARCSIMVLTISFALLSFSFQPWLAIAGLALYTLGSGFTTFARSLLSSLISLDLLGTLYTALSVADTFGVLLAGPGVAMAFRIGIRHGGIWLGMPFMLSTFLLITSCLALLLVKLSRDEEEADESPRDANEETEPLIQNPS